MSKSALTERQRQIYDYLVAHVREHGYPPTIRELGDHFRIRSPQGVMCHLKALEAKGWIEREPGRARAIRVVRKAVET